MIREWLVVVGLGFDIIGALVVARAILLSPKQALEIAVPRYAGETDAENLGLPAVQHLLRQSRYTWVGLLLLVVGFALQAGGQWPT